MTTSSRCTIGLIQAPQHPRPGGRVTSKRNEATWMSRVSASGNAPSLVTGSVVPPWKRPVPRSRWRGHEPAIRDLIDHVDELIAELIELDLHPVDW